MEYYKYDIATLDTLENKYVDFSTAQVITGVKNFSNGLKIKSSQILTGVSGSSNTLVTLDTYNELHEIVTDQETLISNNTSDIATLKSKVNNIGSASVATSSTLGTIKLGSDTVLTATNKIYPVQLNSSQQAYVQVSWSNTTYSNATASNLGLNYKWKLFKNLTYSGNSSSSFANIDSYTNTSSNTFTNYSSKSIMIVISALETAQEGCIVVSTSSTAPTSTTPSPNSTNFITCVSGERGYWAKQILHCSCIVPQNTTYYVWGRYVSNVRIAIFEC